MSRAEARKILELYRPGGIDEKDPQVIEALQLARTDAELAQWLENHVQFQETARKKFNEITVPPQLKDAILSRQKIVRPAFRWNKAFWLSAAATIVLFIGVWKLTTTGETNARVPDRFADYENRMVRSALREYHMDVMTNDLAQVRQFVASQGAPADFTLPEGLAKLSVVGGGALKWRDNPVTMICFNRGDKQMLFLFVMNRSAIKDPPAQTVEITRISRLHAASWSEGDKTYVLAGPEENDFLEKYL